MQAAPRVTLTDEQRTILQRWARGRSTPMRLVRRAQIVLAAAEGKQTLDISEELGIERTIVACWRNRLVEKGWPVWRKTRRAAVVWRARLWPGES